MEAIVGENRSELRFRHSLYASQIIGTDSISRGKAYMLLYKAYNWRNTIAHGDSLKEGNLREALGQLPSYISKLIVLTAEISNMGLSKKQLCKMLEKAVSQCCPLREQQEFIGQQSCPVSLE